ncbi:MAG: acyltransferase [Desulfovibrio sp.]|nr:acyltransferase [Desulfovibrio sp.]
MTSQKEYYPELALFRGFAIFSIIFGHIQEIITNYPGQAASTSWEYIFNYFRILFAPGGTWFFVFISGFLFYAVFYRRGFVYGLFVRDKFKKVVSPYMIFVVALGAVRLLFLPQEISVDFVLGTFFYWSFWYVPFIFCVFLGSPFFISLIESSTRVGVVVFLLSLAFSVAFGRHFTNPLLACVYYLPAYILGLFCAKNYEAFKAISPNIKWGILFVLILYASLLAPTRFALERNFPRWDIRFCDPPAFVVLAKLALCPLFLWCFLWLRDHGRALSKSVLNVLAKYSFTIFFFQQFLIFLLLTPAVASFFVPFQFWTLFAFSWLISIAFCALTICLFAPLKKLLGKRSRRFIGC